MTRPSWLAGCLLAGLFLALHLPFLPSSLEDLDSINFALGVRQFDVSRHQPHPPGYPLFILAAKGAHAIGISEVRALSLIGVLGGALAIFGCFTFFDELNRDRPDGPFTWTAVVLVVTCPLYWLTAARPLSDAAGLAAALAILGRVVSAPGVGALVLAAAGAGFAAGIRSQVVWLTLPLLALGVARLPRVVRRRGSIGVPIAFAVGVLLWLVPLILVSGGPQAYWRAVANQGAEDLSGVPMLATTHSIRLLVSTLHDGFVAPWGYWQAATAVLALAVVGFFQMLLRARPGLLTLVCAFGPYLVFDLLFQEAITTRYALPLVIPVVFLAVRGLSLIPSTPAMAVALAIALTSILVDDPVLSGYSRMDAPAFRMLGDMKAAAAEAGAPRPVLAMHRKEELDMRRPVQWVGDAMPAFADHLPATPKHEWLDLVKYWNNGGRNPIWFVADPLRSDLALVRHQGRNAFYRWPFAFTELLGGARPNEMDWHVLEAPDWYLGEGWSITPETGGIAQEDHRGPGYEPISGWIRRRSGAVTLMIGGRNLVPGGASARVHVAVDGALIEEFSAAPGFFLRMLTLPSVAGTGDYARVTIDSDTTALAIEQFDAQPAGRVVFGFGEGWNEQEYDPSKGVLWRWSSDRSVLPVRAEGHALALTLRGEIEAASTSHVVIRAGQTVVSQFDVGRSFSRTVIIPAASLPALEDVITIETSAWYVPAEKRWRSNDRRRLGLKLFECRLAQAS